MSTDWLLIDDALLPGENVLARGTEDEVKKNYFAILESGGVAERDLYIEDPGWNQFAWNPHTSRWDEL